MCEACEAEERKKQMRVLRVTNVHSGLPQALHMIYTEGVRRESRNGPVLQMPEPTTIVYERPAERVLFHAQRDANPFLHFYECLWMMASRRDVAPLVRYAKRMATFSDNGANLNAAYGYRWRRARLDVVNTDDGPWEQNQDQLPIICARLRENKDDRQQVLQIWDHAMDLGTKTKDHACNIAVTFQVGIDDRLHMVVFNRSNDLVWGAMGANAVHFSFLHEYVALRSGYPIGTYSQVSANLHMYLRDDFERVMELKTPDDNGSPYEYEPMYPMPIANIRVGDEDTWARWDEDCRELVTSDGRAPAQTFRPGDPFFRDVVLPIIRAHDIYKDRQDPDRFADAMFELSKCKADDWRVACVEWLQRRYNRYSESVK